MSTDDDDDDNDNDEDDKGSHDTDGNDFIKTKDGADGDS